MSASFSDARSGTAELSLRAAVEWPSGGALKVSLEPFYVRDSFARAHPDLREGGRDDQAPTHAIRLSGDGLHQSAHRARPVANTPDAFDLVLSDYTMPEMTGHELASALVALGSLVPVVLVTGVVGDLPDAELLAPNVRGVLRKPLTGDELAAAVRRGLADELSESH